MKKLFARMFFTDDCAKGALFFLTCLKYLAQHGDAVFPLCRGKILLEFLKSLCWQQDCSHQKHNAGYGST